MNFIEKTVKFTNVRGIKSTESSKIFILGLWSLREVVIRFNQFLIQGYIISKKNVTRISIIYLTD